MPGRLSLQSTLACVSWLAGLVLSYPFTKDTLPDIDNATFISDCVQAHNKFRSAVSPRASDMLYMTWDSKLAQIAKQWAGNCWFQHNPRLGQHLHPNFTSLGENIWSGSYYIFNVSSAVTSWYNEVNDYDFKSRKCSKVCGHYTQVVWADSFKVGCAVQFCPQVDGLSFPNAAHFICNYGPAGNYPTWPYKKGSTCSACSQDDTCLDNLCSHTWQCSGVSPGSTFGNYSWRCLELCGMPGIKPGSAMCKANVLPTVLSLWSEALFFKKLLWCVTTEYW